MAAVNCLIAPAKAMIANLMERPMAQAKQSNVKQSNVKDTRARILLVDDHAVVRYGIAQLINRQTDMVVCGEEEDASRAMSISVGSSAAN